MLEERRKILTRTIPFILAGFSILILYLYFVGFSKVTEAFARVNPNIFSIAVLATVFEILLFTFTWYYLLKALSVKVKFFRALSYVLVGVFVDILIPAESVSAEISKIYLMNKDGKDVGKVTATLVIQRIYGMIIHVASLAFACLCLFIVNYSLPSLVVYLVWITIGLTFTFLTLIFVFCSKQELIKRFLNKILGFVKRIIPKRFNLQTWEGIIEKGLDTFYSSFSSLLKSPKKLLISIFSAASSWIFCLLVSQLVFYSLGYNIPFIIVVIVYSLSIIVQYVPAGIPAEVGITEIVMSSLYATFGVPLGVSAVATILIRFLTVWLKFILGFVALQWVGIKTITKGQVVETDKTSFKQL